jgi:hypothetical protein
MKTRFDFMLDYADAEFDGQSYNGSSLMATLSSLDRERAAADSSFEGYSAWSVGMHVARCKYLVAASFLGEAGRAELGPYPYPVGKVDFCAPPDASAEAWEAFLAYLRRVHSIVMRSIRESSDEDFERTMPEWGIPNGRAAAWLLTHDSYHNAQIRSMGVPGLKAARVY